MTNRPWRAVLALSVAVPALRAVAGTNLVPNGDFEAGGDWVPPWTRVAGASVVAEEGNRFLRIERGGVSVPLKIELHPDWWTLRLSLRMRVHGVEQGDESWKDARLAMSFHAADGSRVGDWPRVPNASGTRDWFTFEREYVIPRGAVTLALGAANFGRGGQVDFDDVRLEVARVRPAEPSNAPLPRGFPASDPWDPAAAARSCTATRERVCLNGLWRFRPWLPDDAADRVPAAESHWGWFKVPGIWPTKAADPERAPQVIVCAPSLDPRDVQLDQLEQAWYRRRIHIPADWTNRRVRLEFTMLQTHAAVFLDGERVGEVWFPGGRLDLSGHVRAGHDYELTLLVTARPVRAGRAEFVPAAEVERRKIEMKLRGVPGDLFLESVPPQDAMTDVRVAPSVRDGRLGLDVGVEGATRPAYRLRAVVTQNGTKLREFEWEKLELRDGRLWAAAAWPDAPRWDVDTPHHLLDVALVLLDAEGRCLDEFHPVRFGFRDVRLEGREILLNGTPIHLRALYVASANGPAHLADEEAARRLIARMREYGFNSFILANYDVEPGELGYFDALLAACDQAGMLLSFTLPHAKDFDWKLHEPAMSNAFYRLTEWLIRRVQNHPAVVLYAMSHNSAGYAGDQNPLKMDGVYDPDRFGRAASDPDELWRRRSRAQAMLGERIARRIDPDRPVYHHHSGHLGDFHTVNIYLNWAPIQERSDWLAHWSTAGRKPMFFVEWGLPHIASWSSYRGPKFIWRNPVLQCAWVSEFAAAYVGERAYEPNPGLEAVLDLEEELWRTGRPFFWGQLSTELAARDELHREVVAQFAAANWRAHRAWGISAMLPWDQKSFWIRVRPTATEENPARFHHLQRPGIVPDFRPPDDQYLYDPGPSNHFEASAIGRVFARWNQPLCAFIGGDTSGHGSAGPSFESDRRFTELRHLVTPGSTLQKSIVVLSDLRREVEYRYRWQLGQGGQGAQGEGRGRLAPARRQFHPIELHIPHSTPAGQLALRAVVEFSSGETQTDEFQFTVLPAQPPAAPRRTVRLLDPVGATAAMLDRLGVPYHRCSVDGQDLGSADVVVIGERALSHPELEGRALPLVKAVERGARVLMLAQEADALQRRGFRVNVHALRQWFVRSPDHPALAGLSDAHFANWAGSATLIPPLLETPEFEATNPTWLWNGFRNTRVWRAGNLNSVASVLIEKPDRGDWLPLVDGGFDLQYTPLLETTVGAGRVIVCQLEIVHRSMAEPAADGLLVRLLRYLEEAPAPSRRRVLRSGDERLAALLRELNLESEPMSEEMRPSTPLLVVVGPGGGPPPRGLTEAIEAGTHVLALGLDAAELRAWVPGIEAGPRERTRCEPMGAIGADPLLRGLSAAELNWRTRPVLAPLRGPGHPLLRVIRRGRGAIVVCQVAPWQFDAETSARLRTTWRRTVWMVSRLLHNLGASAGNPVLERLTHPAPPLSICLTNGWRGMADPRNQGRSDGWWKPEYDDSAWSEVPVPCWIHLLRPEMNRYTGAYWYRRSFDVPDGFGTRDLVLDLGPLGAPSWVWLNGELVSEVTWTTHPEVCHVVNRAIALPPQLLREKDNRLAVLILASFEAGGIGAPPYLIRAPAAWSDLYAQLPVAEDDPYRYYRW